MRQMLRQIEKLGRTRWPVLIQGETGTGKELIARGIHNTNPVGPFVVVDCSALVGPLMESELFGHSKGAFTGAQQNKLGLLDMANGGTVFLDEIGELPLDMQVKLLRVLQEKEFRAVGALAARRIEFRVISATNRDLAAEVEAGRFRRDLFYRLNVVTLRLPPLRERADDIPVLVKYFLGRYSSSHTISEAAVQALMEYNWPGNVRELEHSIQHMVAVNSGPHLHTGDLPSQILNFQEARTRTMPQVMAATNGSPVRPAVLNGTATADGLDDSPDPAALNAISPLMTSPGVPRSPVPNPGNILPLSEVEKRAIMDALRYTKGDRATAAALLGIGRTTLYRKLKEYELEGQQIPV